MSGWVIAFMAVGVLTAAISTVYRRHKEQALAEARALGIKQPLPLVGGPTTPVMLDAAPDDLVLIRSDQKEHRVISNMIIGQDSNGILTMTPKSGPCAGLMEGCKCARCQRWDFEANKPKGKVLVVIGCGQCGGWCGTCFMEETDSRYPEAAKHELETGEDARYIEEWKRAHPNG